MTRRENQVRRRPPSRHPRTRVLVVCGGVRTERDYLNGLKRRERNPAVQVKVIGKGLDPESLVRHAVELRAHGSDDFDDFELWLLYHHEDRRRPIKDADEAIEVLRRYVPQYAKNALRMEDHADTAAAIERGRRSHDGVRPPGPNPSSGVWRLAELVIAD